MIPVFIEERHIFVRERANGAFAVSAWMLSHSIVSVAPTILCSIAASVACYYLIGLDSGFDNFVFFSFNLFMSVWAAESFMMVVSLLVPVFVAGLLVASTVYGYV